MEVAVKLEIFEGPLDLLLHLIRKNEVDIYDIPVALITRQYLDYLDLMRELNIHLAGDFLVMAATLTHIKSRMLLPVPPSDEQEDEDDPRHDLVAALKEHLRIKGAVKNLEARPWLERDVWARGAGRQEIEQAASGQQDQLVSCGVFELVEAFRGLLARRETSLELSIPGDRVSIEERMTQLIDRLKVAGSLTFEQCFGPGAGRPQLVVTFLALLELTRLGMVKVYQEAAGEDQFLAGATLRIFPHDSEDDQA